MKLLRVGDKEKEIPAIVDNENNYRDLSSLVDDLNPSTLNFEILKKIKDSDISKLPIISKDQRIGSCVNKPGKFIAIGLNYSDHAKETGAKTPTEPIVFMKATSSICGPNDEIEIPKGSTKLDWEVELAIVIGKEAKNISEEIIDAKNNNKICDIDISKFNDETNYYTTLKRPTLISFLLDAIPDNKINHNIELKKVKHGENLNIEEG